MDVIENNLLTFTKSNIRKVIAEIPKTVADAYEKILNKSNNSPRTGKLLLLVLCARRPLLLTEMSVALAIEEQHDTFDEVEQEPIHQFRRTIRDLCGLFVTIVDTKVYLLHQTAKEFLVKEEISTKIITDDEPLLSLHAWGHSMGSFEWNVVVAKVCLSFLNPRDLEDHGVVFIDYAMWNWDFHFQNLDEKL